MKSSLKLSAHDLRRVAVAAGVDHRTVLRRLDGGSQRSTVTARIDDTLRALGFGTLVPHGSGEVVAKSADDASVFYFSEGPNLADEDPDHWRHVRLSLSFNERDALRLIERLIVAIADARKKNDGIDFELVGSGWLDPAKDGRP